MDFLKKNALPIAFSTLGAASLVYFYTRKASKETAQSLPSEIQNNKEDINRLKVVQQKLRELSNAVPRSTSFKTQVSEVLYNYTFTRTAEIEQLKAQSISNCYHKSENIQEAVKGIIGILRQTQESMNQLGSQLAESLQSLSLSTQQNQSISQKLGNLQIQHQKTIKCDYFEQARSHLRQKIAFITLPQGINLLREIESFNWAQQEQLKYHSEVINALVDYWVFKRKGQAKVNRFCLSVAFAQSQVELAEEINDWSSRMEEIYRPVINRA